MPYEVIARKWRPKNFNELIGQNHIRQTLVNSLKNNRVPQALLFNGPRGTGKTSSARIFASTLRCQNVQDYQACGVCQDCVEINQGKSVNVIEIDGASNNGVDSIRELRDSVSYLPPTGKYKIYIIDEVHMLSTSAFNALLKTLEEPPEHVVFILATTELHKVPNTILSRCQKYDFRRVSSKEISDSLKNICDSENITYEEEALWDIAKQADGSMRDSQSLLDQVISYCDNNLTREQTVEALGLTNRKWVIATLKALVERDNIELLNIVEKITLSGQDPNLFIKSLLQEIRNVLIYKLNPETASTTIDLSDAGLAELGSIADQLGEEDLHLLFDMTLKGSHDVIRSSSSQTVLEMLLLKLAAAPRIVHVQSRSFPATKTTNSQTPARKPAQTQTQTQTRSTSPPVEKKTKKNIEPVKQTPVPQAPPTPKPKAQPEPSLNPNSGSPKEQWNLLVGRIKGLNPIAAAKLEHSYLVKKTDTDVTIGFPANMQFLIDQAKDKDFINQIQNYISTLWGQKFNIEFTEIHEKKNDNMSPRELKSFQQQKESEELRRKIEAHPVIKKTQEVFKGEIVAINEIKQPKPQNTEQRL